MCDTYKEQIKVIFKVKTLNAAKNKINRIMGKEDLPDVIYDFLKNCLKKSIEPCNLLMITKFQKQTTWWNYFIELLFQEK